jgi:DNA-binding cell septation regulator SpoVG
MCRRKENTGAVKLARRIDEKAMNSLGISEIQIIPVKPRDGLVAFASCVINQSLYIGNIAIYSSPASESGFRLVYPSKVLVNGKEINCVHPINREAGEILSAAIVGRFIEIVKRKLDEHTKTISVETN